MVAINSIDRTTRFLTETEARFERFRVDPSVLSSSSPLPVHTSRLPCFVNVILACLLAPHHSCDAFGKTWLAHDFLPEWSNSEIGQIGLPVERRNDRTDYIIVYSVTDILENFPLFPLFLPNSETENVGHGPMLVDTYRSL